MIFVNFKTYKEGLGENARILCSIILSLSVETNIEIVPIVSSIDINLQSEFPNIWLQGVDQYEYGAHTGSIIAEEVAKRKVKGVILNHSEKPFSTFEYLKTAHENAKRAQLKTLIFSQDVNSLKEAIKLKPDYISYEPPEFIGRTDISVATAKPEVIGEVAEISRENNVPLIVGAGIHSKDDVITSVNLGAKGIAVAKNIVTSSDPKASLMALVEGFRKESNT